MQKISGNSKIISFVLVLCMIMQLCGIGGAQVQAEEVTDTNIKKYYVGGEGALDTNDGGSSNKPFATLAQAAKAINQSGAGNYEIILQGNTSETEQTVIGNGSDIINVTLICRTLESSASVSGSAISGSAMITGETSVSGSAIIARNAAEYTGTLISISSKATLSLGESSGNSSLTINGMGDKVTGCDQMIDVGSYAALNIYQNVVLCNNNVSHANGGAINVKTDGVLTMYGGSITGITNGVSGAVYNKGTFYLKDGTISLNKGSNYGGGITNDGTFIMDGGSISGNTAADSGGGVYNSGTMKINGGEITGNKASEGAGILNYEIVELNGGVITNNKANHGGGICNNSSFKMTGGYIGGNAAGYLGGGIYTYNGTTQLTGGLIENNIGGAAYTNRELELSGSIEIPAGESNNNYIHANASIVLAGALSSNNTMVISYHFYDKKQVLSGTPELLSKYHTLFKAANTNYEVTDTGILNYIGETATYYVGGPGANDYYSGSDAGSSAHPFATINKALIKNGSNSCVILVQSDITEAGYLYVEGNVTIKSKGTEKHKITVGSSQSSFIINYGSLFLGDSANQDPEETLVIDGNLKSMASSVIYNEENMNLYSGVTITGFKTNKYFLDNLGTFDMYGGTISSNTISSFLVYNEDYESAFRMHGGTISNNTVGSSLISPGVNQISGGKICSNKSEDCLFFVCDSFLMTGGTISNNTSPSVVYVYSGTFLMSGGTISQNTGYGIQSNGTVKMTGGTISDNALGGIYMIAASENSLLLSGNLSITSSVAVPGIYLDGSHRSVTITGALKNTEAITVAASSYAQDNPILTGDPAVIKENRDKFALTGTDYEIDESGYLAYKGGNKTYYVNEASEAAVGDGNLDTPFKTMEDAVSAIGMGTGTIILQSSITLNSPIVIRGTVNLTDDGNGPYTILHGSSYTPYSFNQKEYNQMIVVYGKLAIGNKDNSQSNENPALIIDGGAEENKGQTDEILLNQGTVEIYSGVSLQHNNAKTDAGGIRNCGKLSMYGGRIFYNFGDEAGGIFMERGSSFLMEGGSILNNSGRYSGGLCMAEDCTFTMNGGTIKDNGGRFAGGICMNGGSFTMNGGCISKNAGIVGGLNAADTYSVLIDEPAVVSLTLNGGSISENTGFSLIANTETKIPGIAIGKNVKFKMSKDIQITKGDRIAFIKDMGITGIEITGALTGKDITAAVAVYENLQISQHFVPVLTNPFGLQLLVSGSGYSFTQGDADRFTLVVPAPETHKYAINADGRVGLLLKEDWVSISKDTGITYSGAQKTVDVAVSDGTTTLTRGTDYNVTYLNNIGPGYATVIITGIGNYAGVITKTFYIQPDQSAEPTATVTPIPGHATPTPKPEWHIELGEDKTLHAGVDLSGEESNTSGEGILLPAPKELLEQLAGKKVEKVSIEVMVPDSLLGSNPEQNPGLILNAGLLEAAISSGKQIAVSVKDKNGKERYTWSFNGKEAAVPIDKITDLNMSITVSSISEDKRLSALSGNGTGLILSFSHEGSLPSAATVRIYVGDHKGVGPGSVIYLYHFNAKTGKLETLPYSSRYKVDEDGYITIHIVHCSDYILLTKKADRKTVTSLKDQIKVSPMKKTLYTGGTKGSRTTIKVKLPATLKQVASLPDKAPSDYIGGVTVSYESGNKKVATVNSTGEIKAVGSGKAVITTTVKLYSGKTKIVKIKITVKQLKNQK